MLLGIRLASLTALAILIGLSAISPALAQDKGKTEAAKPKQKEAPPAPTKPAAASQSMPNGAALNILIRRTLLTVNDANMSGNYSVLRDLAAPGFQQANDLKKDPKLVRKPELTKEGRLRLTGFMPTKPQKVNFDMLFENVAGSWRLYGIAVNTSGADAAPKPQASSPAPAKAPPGTPPPGKK